MWRVVRSVFAAFLGVQSQQHYEEDFTEANSIVPYIVVGVVIVALFVLSIVGVLKLFM
ncbi:DUF2970 domain-containing protein [Glaciecola sp. XM2]|nr:DUF2970 domain-containing protein [Glaciecola sp. XM2]